MTCHQLSQRKIEAKWIAPRKFTDIADEIVLDIIDFMGLDT